MKQKWRTGMLMVVAMAMSGCNMVMTERPVFTAADGAGAPPIRPGVWRNLKPGCVVDETLPRSQWPKCALPALTVSDHPTWTEVTGDPDILQAKLPFPVGAKDKTSAPYVYLAFRPLKLDAQGRVVAMKQWFVRCGPPPVSTSTAPANPSPSLPPSAPATSGQASPADNSSDAAPANMREAMARLADASTKLARVAPTTAPLPGLTMNDSGGCTSDSAAAIRNAAKPSEAWVGDDALNLQWVCALGPNDPPPGSPGDIEEDNGQHYDEPAFKLSEDSSNGDLAAVKADLAATTPVDAMDGGETALFFAAAKGRVEVVRLLLAAGANADIRDKLGTSALMMAAGGDQAGSDYRGVVTLLIAHGADLNAHDKLGQTPLNRAVTEGDAGIITILLKAGANPNGGDHEFESPLATAAERGKVEAAKLLIKAGADVNGTKNDLRPPLAIAASEGNLDVAKILIAAGADVNGGYKTPLRAAVDEHHDDVAALLIQHGGRLDSPQ